MSIFIAFLFLHGNLYHIVNIFRVPLDCSNIKFMLFMLQFVSQSAIIYMTLFFTLASPHLAPHCYHEYTIEFSQAGFAVSVI